MELRLRVRVPAWFSKAEEARLSFLPAPMEQPWPLVQLQWKSNRRVQVQPLARLKEPLQVLIPAPSNWNWRRISAQQLFQSLSRVREAWVCGK